MKKRTIFYVASLGGHLTELLEVKPDNLETNVQEYFVTYSRVDSLKNNIVINEYLLHQPILMIRCFFKTLYYILRYRPKVIITTGAQLAFFFVVLSKYLVGAKIIFIECSAQVYTKSLTGKFCYPFSDKFYVQWPELLEVYGKKAEFKGGFLCSL